MKSVNEIYSIMQESSRDIARSVKAAKDAGKKVVGVLPIYVPEEILYAAGIVPIGCWGGQNTSVANASAYLPPTTCSILKNVTEFAAAGLYKDLDALAFSIPCDTFRSSSQNLKIACNIPQIVCNYPVQNKTPRAISFTMTELNSFRTEVEKLVGAKISEAALHDSIRVYNENRVALQEFTRIAAERPGVISTKLRHTVITARLYMDKAEHTALLRELNEQLHTMPAKQTGTYKKVYLAGITVEPDSLLDKMDEFGFVVVGDELAQESRQFRFLIPEGFDAIDRLARFWQLHDSCTFLVKNVVKRQDYIANQAKALSADGIIYCQMNFCDPEAFDFPTVKATAEAAGIPLLKITIDQNTGSNEQDFTRLQAFKESLGG